jgi:hypothetical protein
MKGVYFFPGEGACQASDNEVEVPVSQRPLRNPTIPNDQAWPCHVAMPGWFFNSKHYTYAPSDPRDLHWNDSAGTANGWSSKNVFVTLMAAIYILTAGLFLVAIPAPRTSSESGTYRSWRRQKARPNSNRALSRGCHPFSPLTSRLVDGS